MDADDFKREFVCKACVANGTADYYIVHHHEFSAEQVHFGMYCT